MNYNKELIKDVLPPFLIRQLTGLLYGWYGDFSDWESAQKRCTGYDSDAILEKVREAALQVKEGKALYERDSVLFYDKTFNYPLIATLLLISSLNNGKLNVLDFGGSLGSSFFQSFTLISHLPEIKWNIIEQKNYAEVGQKYFQTEKLHFYHSVDDYLVSNSPDLIILSSVLPYLKEPYELMESLTNKEFRFIFFDKMPFIKGSDRITIQKVNPDIYKASYPCWFFNEDKFLQFMDRKYNVVFTFENHESSNLRSDFKGCLFEFRKD